VVIGYSRRWRPRVVGYDESGISLGAKEEGGKVALPIWMDSGPSHEGPRGRGLPVPGKSSSCRSTAPGIRRAGTPGVLMEPFVGRHRATPELARASARTEAAVSRARGSSTSTSTAAGLDVMSDDPRDLLRCRRCSAARGSRATCRRLVRVRRTDPQQPRDDQARRGLRAGAKILGVHLEGPFLNPERRGTHNPKHIRPPSLREMREYVAAGEGLIRLSRSRPSCRARELIRFLIERGIRVSMGHSTAKLRAGARGEALGVTGVTHLCNAMNALHHREPGLLGFALLDPDLYTK